MNLRNLMIWGLFVAVLLTLFYSVMNPAGGRAGQSAGELTYTQLEQKTDANQVTKAVVRGEQVMVEDKDSRRFTVVLPNGGSADILKRFEAHGVNVQAQSTQPSVWTQLLTALFPFLLLGGLWFLEPFPSVVFGLFPGWFRGPALLAGWAVGFFGGTYLAWTDGLKPLHTLAIGGTNYTMYVGIIALVANIVVAAVLSAVLGATTKPAMATAT